MDPNQPTEVNPVSFGNSLPPELQQQLLELQRRKQLALTMQQQAMQPVQAQSHGPIASRVSPLAPLVQGVTGYLAGRNVKEADTGIAGLQGQYQDQTSNELKQLQGLPMDEAIRQGTTSRNPIVQALANQMRQQREKRLGEYIGATKEAAPNLAAIAARTGEMPDTSIPKPPAPGMDPTGKFGISTNLKGEQTMHFPPVNANNINIRLPGMEAGMALETLKHDLDKRQERAQLAKESLAGVNTAITALNDGAQVGGLEGIKQSVRKIAQGFGIPNADTAPTEVLQMALGDQVLAAAKKLAPVTENDIKYLEKEKGSISSDPQALRNMLIRAQAIHSKELSTYNKWIQVQGSNLTTPYASDMFKGAGVGYEVPTELPSFTPKAPAMEFIRDPATGKLVLKK